MTRRVPVPPIFSIPIRVYYEDTDTSVMYYANYLKFMERARSEWLRHLGFEQDELTRASGVLFAVRSAKLEFLKPARFNELLEVTTEVHERGRASLTFRQHIRRDADILCEGEIRVACLGVESFAPCPIPPTILSRLDAGAQT